MNSVTFMIARGLRRDGATDVGYIPEAPLHSGRIAPDCRIRIAAATRVLYCASVLWKQSLAVLITLMVNIYTALIPL